MNLIIVILSIIFVTNALANPLQSDQSSDIEQGQNQASLRILKNDDKAKKYFFDIINKNVMRSNSFIEDTQKYNICWWTIILYYGKWECGVFTIAEAKIALPDFDSKRQYYRITEIDSVEKNLS